jgi:glycosyltransferase involved in cell wall biosynthesis
VNAHRPDSRIRVLHVVARLNVGGPAYQLGLLGGRLDPARFRALVAHGGIGAGEASLSDFAHAEGCAVHELADLGPALRPAADARSLAALVRLVRRYAPDIVHTHTAKAGAVGRLAALAGARPRPVLVHTFHGHVLEGYFGPVQTACYRNVERVLAKRTDCLVSVSEATVDDLVRLQVARRERFRVIRIGLDLEALASLDAAAGRAFRARAGAADDDVLLTSVGRLVPIKRIDVLLRAVARARGAGARVRLAVVGDGDDRAALEALAAQLGLRGVTTFTGYVRDVRPVLAASDVAVLSSDNEGTPVSLIEAAAARRPAVATAVGGVPEVVTPDTGVLVPRRDERAFGEALVRVAGDPALRSRLGARARRHVAGRFSVARLISETEALYDELLARRRAAERADERWSGPPRRPGYGGYG